MPQALKVGVKQLVEDAKKEIEEVEAAEAIALLDDENVMIVDIRDVRELKRDGKIPGSFHCPRGMLEFWIDPESPYFKPAFGEGKRIPVPLRARLALGVGHADGAAHGPYPPSGTSRAA